MSTRARKTEKCHDLNQSTYIACQHAGRKNQGSNPNEAFSTLKRQRGKGEQQAGWNSEKTTLQRERFTWFIQREFLWSPL